MKSRPPHVLIMAPVYLPDHKAGSATLLANLIKHFDPAHYFFMRGPFMPGEATELPPELKHRRSVLNFPPLSWRAQKHLRPLRLLLTTLQGLWLVLRERPTVIWLNYPYDYTLIAGYIVSKLTGCPLHVFMHDLWEENMPAKERNMARSFEKRVLEHARRVYAITDRAEEHYTKKYKLRDIKILLHSTNLDLRRHLGEPVTDPIIKKALEDGRPTVLFTGNIYGMNSDALTNLIKALQKHGKDKVRLIFCSGHTREWLEGRGLWFEDTALTSVSQAELMRIYAHASVLFLPLAFDTTISRDEIATVFPTKCLEYFMAGKPILCNAPDYSYVAHECTQEKWAHLVSELDPDALWEGLQTVLNDPEYAQSLAQNASRCAEARDSRRIAAQLWEWLTEDC